MIRVKRNKLLTGFLVLGMGLSLVACSSEKTETKKEEAKVAEKKKEEKRIDTQDRTAKLSVPEDLSPYITSSREGVGKMESMLKDKIAATDRSITQNTIKEINFPPPSSFRIKYRMFSITVF